MKHILLCLLFLLPADLAHAQDEEPASTPPVQPDVSPDILALKLSPLTVQELEEKAKSWHMAVRGQAGEISDAAVLNAEAKAGTPEKQEALDKLATARNTGDKLLKNFDVVLDAWEEKGGDTSELRAYSQALKGTKIDPKDTSAMMDAFKRWLTTREGARKWLVNIVIFLVIMLVTWGVAGLIEKIVTKAMVGHKGSSELINRFVEKLIKRTVLVIGLLIALSTFGVKVGPMLALLGGGAFIMGFALQDTLGNFANGLMLLIYQPFDVGDAVEIGGVSGSVDSVSLVNTTIRTWDNKVVLVPNKDVWGQTITNINAAGERRVDMVFGISYNDDIDKTQSILEKIVTETKGVLKEPEPAIKMHELADSSVNFVCRPWAKSSDYWSVYWTITKRVKEEFDKAGIKIPYPQQDVHIHTVGEKAS